MSTTDAVPPYGEDTFDMNSYQNISMVPDRIIRTNKRSPDVRLKKRGPMSDVNYSLPKKRRGGRKGALTGPQLESLRQTKKHGVCIRCRYDRIKVR